MNKKLALKSASFKSILSVSFLLALLLGGAICVVCDMAISGKLTWSLYPISSIFFVWIVFTPLIKLGRKGLSASLVIFSISIIPFLYVINKIIGGASIMPLSIPISVFSVIYLWCVYFIFYKMKSRRLLAGAFSLLLSVPLCLSINCVISNFFSEPLVDMWDILYFSAIVLNVTVIFVADFMKNG